LYSTFSVFTSARSLGVLSCLATALLFGPATSASAALLPISVSASVVSVKGSATNTITNLVFLTDTTISIQSVQVGHLTNFGNFTGNFSYLAEASPVSIFLLGSATLINDQGDKLNVTATILELGTDYPYTVNGVLAVTGGTGKYAHATGTIRVSGIDNVQLSDTVTLDGILLNVAAH